uniref:Uncharacterized protein n=2 Tax=Ceratitis capitata TaxID=7213 RepID=W8AB44_CERCA
MIPTTVSSSPSTATISGGTTGNNHTTSNNGQLNTTLSSSTPTSSSPSISAISPSSAQMPTTVLGLASLILEGRAVADDEFQPQMIRHTATASDASNLSGIGGIVGGGAGGASSGIGNNVYNFSASNLLASTSYGISGNGSGIAVGGGRQSPTCRPSTSRAAASFGGGGSFGGGVSGVTVGGHVINITTNPYAFNNSGTLSGAHARDSSPLYIDPYSNSSSGSTSSSAESTHQRWTQKLCQLRQVSPAANLSTTYEQPVAVEAREPELVALAINESGANNERGDFEIIRRSLLNRTNLNAMSSVTSSATAVAGSNFGAGSAGSSPGSGSENFLYSLQSLATTCLRSGSPSLEAPAHSGMGSTSATGTPSSYRFSSLASPPPTHTMHIYYANTPTATTTAQRFLEQPGSGSSCGSGVQSPRPHWSATMDNSHSALHAKERYMRHATSASSLGGPAVRMPIPGTAVNTTATASAASTNHNNTTKSKAAAAAAKVAASTTASKQPQHGPHCDQFLRKMGLAKSEAAEAEDHFCDMSYVNITCSRWRAYCHRIEAIIGRGEPVCIEVYLGPVNHKILLEQWIITQKEKVPPPNMTLPSLCSAIRSQLYFSQISAWCDLIKKSDKTIYDTGRVIFHTPTGAAGDLATPVGNVGGVSSNAGNSTSINTTTPSSSPSSHALSSQLNNALSMNRRPRLNIFYRIKSFDSTACFNSKPNVHNFPNVNISENCSISVCLKSLPRINGGIPRIGVPQMLNTPAATMATATVTTTTTTITTTTTSTTLGMSSKGGGTSNKPKITKAATSSTTTSTSAPTTTAQDMTSSTCRSSSSIADATHQRLNASNGSFSGNNSAANTLRNGSSYMKSEDTPRTSRTSRCAIANQAAALNTAATAGTASLASTSGVGKSRVFIDNTTTSDQMPLATSTRTTLCSTNSSGATINRTEAAANGESCVGTPESSVNSGCNRVSCAPKHKCRFFIAEEELLAVDVADAEAFGDEDDNTSDAANTTGDSLTNANAFGACANMSHREKQLMKYRKRMLKRDKKHQHHQRKPIATASDATCELGPTLEIQRRQQERNAANSCQPMDEGEEQEDEEYDARHGNDTITTVVTRTSARIEMISTGTQTPMSCCRQCGCEKTLVCMRCTTSNGFGSLRREQAIDDPTEEQDVDDMDESAASSISSSDIIHTPRNKAELLLQAIQRTPKAAAAKHKKHEASRKTCSGKLQNNNHLIGGVSLGNSSTGLTGGKSSSSSSLHENAVSSGCQVCKRQKTQHNFGESKSAATNAANNEQLAGEADNDDIGDDTDDDGGKKLESIEFDAEDAKEIEELPATPISAQVMEEESFLSSTKLTPQIERCTLSNAATKSMRCQLLSVSDRVGGDQKAVDYDRSTNNRTPPIITTLMEDECFDESQFKTPTTTAGGGISYENAQQQQQQQTTSGGGVEDYDEEKPPPIPPKESSPTQISGILKGGKLWKQDSMSQSDDQNNTTSEDEGGTTKRSVRFVTEDLAVDGEGQTTGDAAEGENQINELIPIKKHSTLFNNALRPNSAVRQLFPSVAHQTPVLTSEALRAFDESKRAGCLVPNLPGCGDTDTIRRSIERNILRRSLIKKKAVKSDISLEERIKQLTCDIDETNEDSAAENGDEESSKLAAEANCELTHRGSPMGEENPQKFANGNSDKSFSPSSSVSSSSSGSSAYKKISDIFNRDKKQDKILEMEENPIVIIPQECRCPAAPDLGMGIQVPVVHTQIHRTPPRQVEPKRQFLSTLAPLTACVAGNKDDLSSYYTLAAAHHSGHVANNAQFAEFNLGGANLCEQPGVIQAGGGVGGGGVGAGADEVRKVAPDVIAGTPGQEQQDELAAFAQQEANRTEKIKKRYTNENSNNSSDDDEQNDYGFNKRPSVRGIKPKFSSTNEILQQMQEQLNQQMPSVAVGQPINQAIKSYTLPKQASTSSMTKQISQNPSPQNVPHPVNVVQQQQQQQKQQ